ncbi:hypothetical protein JCM15765_04440 [Paradesulfitobacterium aromaticivorans]
MTEYHCEYCQFPKDLWSPALKTYHGDECKLYDSFSSLIEDGITPQELTMVAQVELPKEFSNIPDIDMTVKELVQIVIDCGVIREGGERRCQNP